MDDRTFNVELTNLLRSISINRMQNIHKLLLPFELSPTQCMVLMRLHSKGGELNISEISRHTQMPPSNISTICKRLERRNLISRCRSDTDERIVNIAIAPAGNELCKRLSIAMEDEQARFAAPIPKEDRYLILSVLKKLDDAGQN